MMENYNMQVPYIVHEASEARLERIIKRLWVVVIILIVLVVATNGAWIWYESQFEYFSVEVQQENDRGINNFTGEGSIWNGDEALNIIQESDADGDGNGPEA